MIVRFLRFLMIDVHVLYYLLENPDQFIIASETIIFTDKMLICIN